MDTVNMPYHHGALRDTLIDAALPLARSGGPDAVVLRAVTRAAHVSHNAAYRHFADREELVLAVGERCMEQLTVLMERRLAELGPDPDPVRSAWSRLHATGYAYIEFALAEPGWFRTAFRTVEGHPGDGRADAPAALGSASSFRLLGAALDGLVEVGALAAGRREGAEFPAWAAVHGIATLLLDGPLAVLDGPERQAIIERVVTTVGTGL